MEDRPASKKINRRDLVWIIPAAAATGFFGWFGSRVYRIQKLKTNVGEPVWLEGPKISVAKISDFPKDWDSKYFDYPISGGVLSCVLLRTPEKVVGGISVGELNFLALSRVCTHQGCIVNYVDNPELGSIAYNYRSEAPFMGCPCHFGAFDVLQAGRAVHGPPRLPLRRIRISLSDSELFIIGTESI